MLQPNLTPPITTVAAALDYKSQLEAVEPKVHYLMSLYVRRNTTFTTEDEHFLTVDSFTILSLPPLSMRPPLPASQASKFTPKA